MLITMAILIKKPSVESAYNILVEKILKDGNTVETEFGEVTKEILNVVVEITNPKLKRVPNKYPLGEEFVKNYTDNLLYGSKTKFSYDYHERLFKYKGVNQIDFIVNKLKEQKNSRRALAITWIPEVDIEISKDDRGSVPCLQYIQFLIRDNNLYQTVLFRSNDILLAFPANAIGLITLGEEVAKRLGIKLKNYTHISVSAHIYIERDKDYIIKNFPEFKEYI